MKRCISIVFVLLILFPLFSGKVLALSYDTNRYYWDCDSMVGPVEDCLKERIIPLNYYPFIGIGLIVIISCFFILIEKEDHIHNDDFTIEDIELDFNDFGYDDISGLLGLDLLMNSGFRIDLLKLLLDIG